MNLNLPIFEFIEKFDLPPELVLLLLFIPILPNIWAIWHAYRSKVLSPVERLVWILVAVFFPVVGGLIYIFASIKRSLKKQDAQLKEQP